MKMNYVVLGTNDMEAAIGFYDALLEGQPVQKMRPSDRMTYWVGADFAFAVALPFDGEPATNGNGTMIGFEFDAPETVKELYEKALKLGATSEGAPNQRGPKFSAYLRDLDRNKICLSG